MSQTITIVCINLKISELSKIIFNKELTFAKPLLQQKSINMNITKYKYNDWIWPNAAWNIEFY